VKHFDERATALLKPVAPARMAAWIFRYEDKGERIKR